MESRVWRLQHRQDTSPGMMSRRQVRLLRKLEHRECEVNIALLQLELSMEEKKGEEGRLLKELATAKPELELLQQKSERTPWLLSAEDKAQLTDQGAKVANLQSELKERAVTRSKTQERLEELLGLRDGHAVKSEVTRQAEQLVQELSQLHKDKKLLRRELQAQFEATPWKVEQHL